MWDIFVYDQTQASLTRVSMTETGGERNQRTESVSRVVAPTIFGNGRYVAFATTATNLVSGDTNAVQDIFVVDTQNGQIDRASFSSQVCRGMVTILLVKVSDCHSPTMESGAHFRQKVLIWALVMTIYSGYLEKRALYLHKWGVQLVGLQSLVAEPI
jgi:hypothetical protein